MFLTPEDHSVVAFKAGYEEVIKARYTDEEWAARDHLISMRPNIGTGDERLRTYQRFSQFGSCGESEETARKLAPLYRAIRDEALALKVSEEHQKTLDFYKRQEK